MGMTDCDLLAPDANHLNYSRIKIVEFISFPKWSTCASVTIPANPNYTDGQPRGYLANGKFC